MRTMALARAALWLVLSTLACCVLTSKSGVAGGTRFNPAKVSFSDLYQTWNDGYKQSLYLTSQADKQRSDKELTGTGIAWQIRHVGAVAGLASLDHHQVAHARSPFRPAAFSIAFRVPGGTSRPVLPDTVRTPGNCG